MKLEQQVCSLELSQKLKALGVPQKSLFYWHIEQRLVSGVEYATREMALDAGDPSLEDSMVQEAQVDYYPVVYFGKSEEAVVECSAFTVAELGEMLSVRPNPVFSFKDNQGWNCSDGKIENLEDLKVAHTEADARAKMLIYLIEQELVNLDQKKGGV